MLEYKKMLAVIHSLRLPYYMNYYLCNTDILLKFVFTCCVSCVNNDTQASLKSQLILDCAIDNYHLINISPTVHQCH